MNTLLEGRTALRTMIAAGLAPTGGPFDGWDPINNPTDPLIIIDPGTRTFRALVAPFNSCILNGREAPGVCRRPPRDGQDYAYAHTGGDVGIIGRGLDHADGTLSASAAAAHYANTGTATFISHYYEDDEAIWAMGLLTPNVTDDDIVHLEASALSGDWRWIEEERRLRMIASQVVNTPGFRKAYDRYDFAMADLAMTASANGDEHELSLITTWEASITAAPEPIVRGTVTDMTGTNTTCTCQQAPASTTEVVAPEIDAALVAAVAAAVDARLASLDDRITALAESITAAPFTPTAPPAPVAAPATPPAMAPEAPASPDDRIAGIDERLTAVEEVLAALIADSAQLDTAAWSAQPAVAPAV